MEAVGPLKAFWRFGVPKHHSFLILLVSTVTGQLRFKGRAAKIHLLVEEQHHRLGGEKLMVAVAPHRCRPFRNLKGRGKALGQVGIRSLSGQRAKGKG